MIKLNFLQMHYFRFYAEANKNCTQCCVVSAARSKKKKGAADKKVAGHASLPKTEPKKAESDVVSDIAEYVSSGCCFCYVLNRMV